jgi:hypothetical protein
MLRVLLFVLCFTFFHVSVSAQVYNGKHLIWKMPDETDKRFTVLFGSTGRSFGTEGCSISVTNRHTNKLFIEFKLTITDFCGQSTERKITRTIEPGKTAGSSAWFDGFDYNTKCTENKKYGENFYTRIKSISLDIVKIVEYDSKGKPIVDPEKEIPSDNPSDTGGETNPPDKIPTSTGGKGNYSSCNAVTPTIRAGYACAVVDWWCSVGTNMMKGDSLIQITESQNFIVKWRMKGEYAWKDVRAIGCPRGTVVLSKLDPCTKYEVVLVRDCGKGVYAASTVLEFTTACNSPEMLNIINITTSSASVSHRIRSAPFSCGEQLPSYVSVVEYKTGTGPWDTLVCVPGQGCKLSALLPGTTYRVRVRFRYNNSKYSEYSKEVVFTTKK